MTPSWMGNDTRPLELGQDEVQRGLEGGERVLSDVPDEGVVLYGQAAYRGERHRAGGVPALADTKRCTASACGGWSMAKARQFLGAGQTIATVIDDQEIADAFANLLPCPHAGALPRPMSFVAAPGWACTTQVRTTTKLWRVSPRLGRQIRGQAAQVASRHEDQVRATVQRLHRRRTRRRAGRTAAALVAAASSMLTPDANNSTPTCPDAPICFPLSHRKGPYYGQAPL